MPGSLATMDGLPSFPTAPVDAGLQEDPEVALILGHYGASFEQAYQAPLLLEAYATRSVGDVAATRVDHTRDIRRIVAEVRREPRRDWRQRMKLPAAPGTRQALNVIGAGHCGD